MAPIYTDDPKTNFIRCGAVVEAKNLKAAATDAQQRPGKPT
jgi:hypothetical protein